MRHARIAAVLFGLWGLCMPAGCESDYTLGQDTPAGLQEATPSPTVSVTPPTFSPTASPTPATPEPGGWVASVRIEPPEVDLGARAKGCEAAVTLEVFNDGTVPIEVTNLRLVGQSTAFGYDITDDLSVLEPGGMGHIWVAASADTEGSDTLELQVNATEGLAARVPMRGQVVYQVAEQVDTYYQEPQNDVDVLWVIDNSGSMGDDQEALAENFDAFMNYFVPMGIHYHMGVVTTDMGSPTQFGKMQGNYSGQHYIDWTMRETGDDAFRDTIKTLGDNGSGTERGLSAMQIALSPDLQAGHNAGFLREDAYLAVIFLSDEHDQSPGYDTVPDYTKAYIDYLVTLKGAVENVICSAIINIADTGGYADMAVATGGVIAEIHQDYYEILLEIGRVSAGFENTFDLSADPEQGTSITVTVNGEEVPQGANTWTYDEQTGQITFTDDAIPQEGDRVDITYTAPPSCDPILPRAAR